VKSNPKRAVLWACLILLVVVGVIGCRSAAPTPTTPPPVTRVEPPPPPPPPEIGMREPGVGEIPMEPPPPQVPPIRAPRGIEFEFADIVQKVFFEFDKSSLTEQARAVLQENAAWLRQHPDIKVQIEGHCDERGTIEYNLALGERRGMSVRNYLVSSQGGFAPAFYED
jgi:peptidoglycan-associated lipoprotein